MFINGTHNGFTNKLIRIDAGEYTFTIEGDDYTPEKIKKYIENTNSLDPEKITFERET